jgi:hypothetical protein
VPNGVGFNPCKTHSQSLFWKNPTSATPHRGTRDGGSRGIHAPECKSSIKSALAVGLSPPPKKTFPDFACN